MGEPVKTRFSQLVKEGAVLYSSLEAQGSPVVDGPRAPVARAWMLSAVNLIEHVAPDASRFTEQARQLAPQAASSIYVNEMGKLLGILQALAAEWTAGLLEPLEARFAVRTLATFLEDARQVLADSNDHYQAAGVLASAVFEDGVRRLCLKHGMSVEKSSLAERLDGLKAKNVITKVSNRRLQAFVTLRNAAFHADWNAFSATDVSHLIEAADDLLESHFGEESDGHRTAQAGARSRRTRG